MAERWRQIPSFPYYEASSEGRIRRRAGSPRAPTARLLRPRARKPRPGCIPYLDVALSHDGAVSMQTVHKLVAPAFLGPPPSASHEVAHGDHNPAHNRPANLSWRTSSENKMQSAALGRYSAPKIGRERDGAGRFL